MLAAAMLIAGCAMELPGFVGRAGDGRSAYAVGEITPLPDPAPLPMRLALAERGLNGVILRAEGQAPTQGYHSAELRPLGAGAPDAAGIASFELVAVPPAEPQAAGPERTRRLDAAVFLPDRAWGDARAIRVSGAGTVETLSLR